MLPGTLFAMSNLAGPTHDGDEQSPTFGSERATANGTVPLFDDSVPNVARIYDYLLGGKDNYPADRDAAEKLVKLIPDAVSAAHQNRAFLQRAVQFLVSEAGIRQFIDIGTGLPTQGSVHQVVHQVIPDARVLYVDYDPVVIAHAQALLAREPTVVAINRDLRKPEDILAHPALQALIDLSKPVAILLVAVLHFVKDDEDPYGIVDALTAAMTSGSYLVLSHVTDEDVPGAAKQQAEKIYEGSNASVTARSQKELKRFFGDLEIVEPGIVDVSKWRTEWPPVKNTRTLMYGAVARKP